MTLQDRRRSLFLAAAAFVIVLIVWQIPALNGLLYPFRFFVTTIHELGHGLAALLTGGRFLEYQVFANGAGVATTAGGTRWVIIMGGYLGTAIFGAALLMLTNSTRRTRWIAFALGVVFLGLGLAFARSLPALLTTGIMAVTLILLGLRAYPAINTLVLNLLAMITGLNAVLDLLGLLNSLNSSVITSLGGVPNDAYAMHQLVGLLSPQAWAMFWIALSVLLLGASVYFTFVKPLRPLKREPIDTMYYERR